MKYLSTLLFIGASICMASCGSSDKKGTFLDFPIEGVAYTTEGGVTGFTDKNGQFELQKDQKIVFSIGSIELFDVQAAENLTLMSLMEQKTITIKDLDDYRYGFASFNKRRVFPSLAA